MMSAAALIDIGAIDVSRTLIEEIYKGSRFNQSSVPQRLVQQDNLVEKIDEGSETEVLEVSK